MLLGEGERVSHWDRQTEQRVGFVIGRERGGGLSMGEREKFVIGRERGLSMGEREGGLLLGEREV